ncbi:MAG: hypothetical protein DVB28_001400 [Verrucomicrobia bacterium]|nr:MAG: hypothetical protein DVB28_001400 [Verrucomicrobiota bacterium]
MNRKRLSCLIGLYLDGGLSPSEKAEFENTLLSYSAARSQFWSETKLHDQLRTVEQEDCFAGMVTEFPAKAPRVFPEPSGRAKMKRWLRPVTAAAAGIVLSALCTSAVWAYAGQRLGAKSRPLPIVNQGFEAAESVPPAGIPDSAGQWSGDYSKVVTAENGIQPHNGKQMLRFLRADNALAEEGSINYVGEAVQVLDLRRFRSEVNCGTAQIDITGWFASLPVDGEQFNFLIKAASFPGDPKDAPALWSDFAHSSLSMVQHQILAVADPTRWQPLTVSIPVPPTADFLVFECGVLRVKPRITEGTAEFPGHYVDDVSLRLRIPN